MIEVARELADRLPSSVPNHVILRMARFVGDIDSIEFINVDSTTNETHRAGVALVFTEILVISSTWNTPIRSQSRDDATATVSAWPRTTLRSVSLEPDSGEQINLDSMWGDMFDFDEEWPWSAQLRLKYDGIEHPIKFPLKTDGSAVWRKKVGAFVPRLLVDLASKRS